MPDKLGEKVIHRQKSSQFIQEVDLACVRIEEMLLCCMHCTAR